VNRSALRALALVLPLLGLAATWTFTHVRAQQGTEWDVPIAGYDPRDLLRGHYVIFTYDWPGLEESGNRWDLANELCIHGAAPAIDRVTPGAGPDCAHPVRAHDYSDDFRGGVVTGRLYVSQAEGARLQQRLTDPALQGTARVRVRDDGHVTPLAISFRPRPAEPALPGEAEEP
jgi:hypothetical protein